MTTQATIDPSIAAELANQSPLSLASQSSPSAMIHADRSIPMPARYSAPDAKLRQSLNESRQVIFMIDEDMILAAQDQARSMSLPFDEWCQQVLNDALRNYLGV